MMLGDVDLTQVDLTKPFKVDFSIAAIASITAKRAALARGRAALEAFQDHANSATAFTLQDRQRWLIRSDLDMRVGRCVLHVYPIPRPEEPK